MPHINNTTLGGTPLRYKLQVLLTRQGVPIAVEINSALVHDVHFLEQLKLIQLSDCVIIADKGHLSSKKQELLFQEKQIKVITPMKANMKTRLGQWNAGFRRIRKRTVAVAIETFFSQPRRRTALRSLFNTKNIAGHRMQSLWMDYVPEFVQKSLE